ncbi:MAG: DUF2490 domain-containing protein [Bacteroidota bacterium]
MYRRFARLFILCMFISCTAIAQERDFGTWYTFSLSHKLDARWSVGMSEQIRLNRNLSTVDLFFTEASVQYVLAKNLKASVNYRFIRKNELDYWSIRHGFFADLSWRRKFKPIVIGARGRVQARTEDFFNPTLDMAPDLFFRTRIQVTYDPGGRTEPFASVESFVMLHSASDPFLNGNLTRMRYEAGIQHDFDKRNSVTLSYLVQFNRIVRLQEYILCIGYSYGF